MNDDGGAQGTRQDSVAAPPTLRARPDMTKRSSEENARWRASSLNVRYELRRVRPYAVRHPRECGPGDEPKVEHVQIG
jgi:hypothetical protein